MTQQQAEPESKPEEKKEEAMEVEEEEEQEKKPVGPFELKPDPTQPSWDDEMETTDEAVEVRNPVCASIFSILQMVINVFVEFIHRNP